jgi:hypothetical protein
MVQTHTILGSRTQRGLMQLALDVIFRSLGTHLLDTAKDTTLESSIAAADASEASILCAPAFLESVYADLAAPSRGSSRAQTPMIVCPPTSPSRVPLAFVPPETSNELYPTLPRISELGMSIPSGEDHSRSLRMVEREDSAAPEETPLHR